LRTFPILFFNLFAGLTHFITLFLNILRRGLNSIDSRSGSIFFLTILR
jgi:hypothetical protein